MVFEFESGLLESRRSNRTLDEFRPMHAEEATERLMILVTATDVGFEPMKGIPNYRSARRTRQMKGAPIAGVHPQDPILHESPHASYRSARIKMI